MRVRRLSFLFAPLILLGPTYLACQLVDPASDLDGDGDDAGKLPVDASLRDVTSEADGAFEATVADTGNDGDADSLQTDAAADAGTPDATPFCLGVDATLCDGFDQEGPVNAAPAQDIAGATCDTGSIVVSGGQLDVDHPQNDGTKYSVCALASVPGGNISGFTLDYDFSYHPVGVTDAEATTYVIVSSVKLNLPKVNDAGILNIDFQLLLDTEGEAQLIALPYYPDASKSSTGLHFPSFQLGNIYSPKSWLPQSSTTLCHLHLAVNTVQVTGTATATCPGTSPVALTVENDSPPPGISAPATLLLGYIQTGNGYPNPEWTLSYDNVILRTSP